MTDRAAPAPTELPAADGALVPYYSARAAEYESIYAKPERQADLARLHRWLRTAFTGRDLLEIACGTAYWTATLAEVAGSIVAVDASEEVLGIAARKAWPADRTPHFMVADAYALPESLRAFPAAFAGFFWSHIPRARIGAFLRALSGHLAPDARVVLLDNRYVHGSSTPISEADDEGNTWQQRTLRDGSRHRVLKNFPTEAQLRADLSLLAAAVEYLEFDYFWLVDARWR